MQISAPIPAERLIEDPIGVSKVACMDTAIRQILARDDAIEVLQEVLETQPQAPCPVIHRFGPGVYIREIHLTAGTFIVGARHKTEHLNIMLTGKITVRKGDGSVVDLQAPMIFVGAAGHKAAYVHEDCVWQNVYSTDERDVETLERMLVDRLERKAIGHIPLQVMADRMDYQRLLEERGIDNETVLAQLADPIPFPLGSYKVMVSSSPIDGRGLFATAPIDAGEVIAPAKVDGRLTPAGRYTNHSLNPNAQFVLRPNGDLDLVAIKDISGMHGGGVGEEVVIDYRSAFDMRGKPCLLQ